MNRIPTIFIAVALPSAFIGCATIPPPAAVEAPSVLVTYVDARDELFPTVHPTGSSGMRMLKDEPDGIHRDGPYLSVARKCNAEHTACKWGVVKLGLEYTVHHVGAEWILDGNVVSSISRSQTFTTTIGAAGTGATSTYSKKLPDDIQLIDDEPTGSKHFHWVARSGAPLQLDGPAGSSFRLEVIPHE